MKLRARAEREVDPELAKVLYDGLEIEPVDGWKQRGGLGLRPVVAGR